MRGFLEEVTEMILQSPWSAAVAVLLIAPVSEELFFRGLLLRGFLMRYRPGTAIIASAFLFSAAHLNPLQGIPAFFLGLYFGWLFVRTRSLWPCILAHALNNMVALGGVFLAGEEDLSGREASLSWWLALPAVLILWAALTHLRSLVARSQSPSQPVS